MTTNTSVLDILTRREANDRKAADATIEASRAIYWNALLTPAAEPSARAADALCAALTTLGRSLDDLKNDAKDLAELARIRDKHDLPAAVAAAKEAHTRCAAAFAEAKTMREQADTIEANARFAKGRADAAVFDAQAASRTAERLKAALREKGCPPNELVPSPPTPPEHVLVECIAVPKPEVAFQKPIYLFESGRRSVGDRFFTAADISNNKYLRLAADLDAEREAAAAERERERVAEAEALQQVLDGGNAENSELNPETLIDGYEVGQTEGDASATQGETDGQQVPEQQGADVEDRGGEA